MGEGADKTPVPFCYANLYAAILVNFPISKEKYFLFGELLTVQ